MQRAPEEFGFACAEQYPLPQVLINGVTGQVEASTQVTGKPTYRAEL